MKSNAGSQQQGRPSEARASSVLVADDHDLFSDMLKFFLEGISADMHVETVRSFPEAQAAIAQGGRFDLVLLDLNMPGMNGLTGLTRVIEQCPGTPVALISGNCRISDIKAAIRQGAAGFIPKTLPAKSLRGALMLILSGERYLPASVLAGEEIDQDSPSAPGTFTPREAEVFQQLLGGRSNKEIGSNLNISELTVKTHLQSIFAKLGAKSRADAIRIGLSRSGKEEA